MTVCSAGLAAGAALLSITVSVSSSSVDSIWSGAFAAGCSEMALMLEVSSADVLLPVFGRLGRDSMTGSVVEAVAELENKGPDRVSEE